MSIIRRSNQARASSGRTGYADPPAVPPGQRIYVFGDVHGRIDLFDRCKAAILLDWKIKPAEQMMVIGLGDYIDRGPESQATIESLTTTRLPGQTIYLRGNHEQLMIDFLEDPSRAGPMWFENGGINTLTAYHVDVPNGFRRNPDFRPIRDQLVRRIPIPHLLFLQGLELSYEAGDYFFVHAGVRPGIPLRAQKAMDLLWIRHRSQDEPSEKVIVHGHTPVAEPFIGRYSINIDTGAYLTDRLTCLVLEASDRRFLKV
jgi:serine/threonine protein phosphatase 1